MQFHYENLVRLAGRIVDVARVTTEGYAEPILKVTVAVRQTRGDRVFEQTPQVSIYRAGAELTALLDEGVGDAITLDARIDTNPGREGRSFINLVAWNSSVQVLPKELFSKAAAPAPKPVAAEAPGF